MGRRTHPGSTHWRLEFLIFLSSFPADSSSGYPVLVFVHGESYSWGSANLYDGRVLAAYAKAIVVTFNYRLGVFGEQLKGFF